MRYWTKKHYVKVAEILKALQPECPDGISFNNWCGQKSLHNKIIREFSQAFQADAYDKFDLNKFQKECYKN